MTELDWMTRANARAKGKRPDYLESPEQEKMMSMLMAVIGEVSVLKSRLDTVERLLDDKGTISRADIDAYAPYRAAGQERGEMIREYITRIMRGPQQAMEAMEVSEVPLADVSIQLQES